MLAFQNALYDRNADWRVKRGDDICTCGTLTSELTRLIKFCVQQASICTLVSSSTFDRERHCKAPRQLVHGFVSLLAKGLHCCAGRAIR